MSSHKLKDNVFTLKDFNILYINLDRRPDRRKNVEDELRRLNLKGTRISGIDARRFNQREVDYWMSRKNFNTLCRDEERVMGRVGCYLSHLKAINYAIENKIEQVLILEDDVKFLVEDTNTKIYIPKECELFYLGGLYWWKTNNLPMLDDEIDDIIRNEYDDIDLTFENIRKDNYYYNRIQILPKYFRIACAYAYVIPNLDSLYSIRHTLLTKTKKAVDMMYVSYLQTNDNSYIMNPSMCIQSDAFFSDVTDIGNKTPSKPRNNVYFYDHTIYTIPRVQEFFKFNYTELMNELIKYYAYNRLSPDPNLLFKHLRWLKKNYRLLLKNKNN